MGFLDSKHGEDWAIWEFRAEGTGYPDNLVYDRIRHYPWPDHHPPPFGLVPLIMASMRNWLHGGDLEHGLSGKIPAGQKSEGRSEKRVAVVHCKAGKGRSGTMSCSYLIAEEGWAPEDALQRFTERRMRPMFGAGVSIPSQLRWVSYVDRWTRHGKVYRDRPIEIVEIHTWGLRDGVKVEVEGFVDDGKKIHVFHTFKKEERFIVEGGAPGGGGWSDMVWDMAGYPSGEKAPDEAEYAKSTNNDVKGRASDPANHDKKEAAKAEPPAPELIDRPTASRSSSKSSRRSLTRSGTAEPGGKAVIFRPKEPIQIAHSDVNVSVERRNKTHKSIGLTMVSAVGHVWFNTFFEGQGPEQHGMPNDSGVFCIEWDAMDGIKGSSRKGSRALDKLAVVWRFADKGNAGESVAPVNEGEAVPQTTAADWKGADDTGEEDSETKKLGLRAQSQRSADVSRANSVRSVGKEKDKEDETASLEGVKSSGPSGEDLT